MILQHFMLDVGSQEVNIFLMADERTRVALMVDAGALEPLILETVAELGLNVTHILLTHLHWDHVDGLPAYLEAWPGATVLIPTESAEILSAPGLEHRHKVVRPGETFRIGPFTFEVIQTSGHTPESVSYYCRDSDVCFVGDALFAGSVGGTESDALYAEQLAHLRRSILTLPDRTEILPGHGPITTVEIERRANPFFQPGFKRK